jgi:hypothetical protein
MDLSLWTCRHRVLSSAAVAGALLVVPAAASARPSEGLGEHERASASAKMKSDATVARLNAARGGPVRLSAHAARHAHPVRHERVVRQEHSARERPLPPALRPEPPRSKVTLDQQKLLIERGVKVPELDGRVAARAFALLAGGVLLLHSLRTLRRSTPS